MRIEVFMGGKRYGGYDNDDDYEVKLDYSNFSWDAGAEIDFDKHKDVRRQVESALLGKRASASIKVRWSNETIVYRGETIAKLHIPKICENWGSVDFGKNSFAGKIEKFVRQCTRQVLKSKIRETPGVDIKIEFKYGEGYSQSGGAVVLSVPVAKWLGRKLLEASSGDLEENGCAVAFDESGRLIIAEPDSESELLPQVNMDTETGTLS
ncbi:MAG: hypothetical protein HY706_13715 [Candidatus Hydrogenedentes bacterium]|nr:hypothetical protein [Candidatus Hydrogenedentota bacterium]